MAKKSNRQEEHDRLLKKGMAERKKKATVLSKETTPTTQAAIAEANLRNKMAMAGATANRVVAAMTQARVKLIAEAKTGAAVESAYRGADPANIDTLEESQAADLTALG